MRQRTQEIRNAASTLNRIGQLPKELFLADQMVFDAAKYRLVVATEASISICAHLAARLASKAPDSYAHCFEILAIAGILLWTWPNDWVTWPGFATCWSAVTPMWMTEVCGSF